MPRPDPAVATTADRLAARLPHLAPLQLAQVAEDIVNGVDETRFLEARDGIEDLVDELNALRAAHGAAQQRIADLEGRGLAGTKVGPYVLVPADLLKRAANVYLTDYMTDDMPDDGIAVLDELGTLVYREAGQ